MKTHAYSAQRSVVVCAMVLYTTEVCETKKRNGVVLFFILFSYNISLIGSRNETNLLRIVWPFLPL